MDFCAGRSGNKWWCAAWWLYVAMAPGYGLASCRQTWRWHRNDWSREVLAVTDATSSGGKYTMVVGKALCCGRVVVVTSSLLRAVMAMIRVVVIRGSWRYTAQSLYQQGAAAVSVTELIGRPAA